MLFISKLNTQESLSDKNKNKKLPEYSWYLEKSINLFSIFCYKNSFNEW
jgi:hypothetical protein